MRPSLVATRHRDVTQPQARRLYEQRAEAVGLRWWSIYEALAMNVTLFDRAVPSVRLTSVQTLSLHDPMVRGAAQFFGLSIDHERSRA